MGVQKKVLQNPKMSAGAAGIAAAALLYLFSGASSNDIDDENIDTLPDYARPDCDFEFTQRFGVKNKNKSLTDRRAKRIQNKQTNKDNTEDDLENMNNKQKDIKYSLLDPNNPNYTHDMKRDEDNDLLYESDADEGFSTDQYYVPFRVNNAKTKRKPDAPFMAMFAMYANKEQSIDIMDDDDVQNKEQEEDDNNNDDNNNNIDNEEEDEKKSNNADIGTSPPLNPLIPSHGTIEMKLNPLDNLREQYNKQNIPQSLQPDALSNAFQSEPQQRIQNDLNEDDSLLNGIRQSVQMMTHSND